MRVGIFGAALDTGNLGVSALGISTVRGLQSGEAGVECTLFDHGQGRRRVEISDGADWTARVQLEGVAFSRRLYRLGNLQQLIWAARARLQRVHPVLRALTELDAILDIGGGDSFSDLYGQWRFDAVMAPKRLALALGIPLVLLPQTYGPYRRAENETKARSVVLSARQVWARDPRSMRVLTDLRGELDRSGEFRQGVDVAFGLPIRRTGSNEVHELLARARARGGPVLGVNASGLLFNTPGEDRRRFGLRDSYPEIVQRLIGRLLEDSSATVLLVPHVVSPCAAAESDLLACRKIRGSLRSDLAERVEIVPELADPMEMKWVIGQCDWFTGMRMHACVASLSQAVPTVAIAYSDKSQGVFETAGAADCVVDPRQASATEVVEQVVRSLRDREGMRSRLVSQAAELRTQWESEFSSIRSTLRSECASP